MSDAASVRPAHILVVEDNPTDVYILRKSLERAQFKFELTHLENGEDALEFLLHNGSWPDAIVLDINLPRVTGDELLRDIRNSSDLSQIPVVVLTGSESPEDRQKMTAFQVDRYLVKSSSLQDFMQIGQIIKDLVVPKAGAAGHGGF